MDQGSSRPTWNGPTGSLEPDAQRSRNTRTGHLERAIDVLSTALPEGNIEQLEFVSDRLRSSSTHGTGCAFATALAANLAQGRQLQYAIVLAKAYVTKAISRALPLGKGVGPLHHLYRTDEQPRPAPDVSIPMHPNTRGAGED